MLGALEGAAITSISLLLGLELVTLGEVIENSYLPKIAVRIKAISAVHCNRDT